MIILHCPRHVHIAVYAYASFGASMHAYATLTLSSFLALQLPEGFVLHSLNGVCRVTL